jgi:hypothetical protein
VRGLALCRRGTRCIADLIADAGLLRTGELRETLAVAPRRLGVQPAEPREHDRPVALTLRIGRAHPFIDEIDDADAGRARGVLIGGNDEVGEDARELPLRRGEGERPDVPRMVRASIGSAGADSAPHPPRARSRDHDALAANTHLMLVRRSITAPCAAYARECDPTRAMR